MNTNTTKGNSWGYQRISSQHQNLDRQIDALSAYDIRATFSDKLSGKDTNRPELQKLLSIAFKGDTIVVSEMSRLSRSVADMAAIVKECIDKGVSVHFVKENQIFDASSNSTAFLLLNLLSSVANWEREIINERIKDGVKAAQKRGVKFGRPAVVTEQQKNEIKELGRVYKSDKKVIASTYNISVPMVYKILVEAYTSISIFSTNLT